MSGFCCDRGGGGGNDGRRSTQHQLTSEVSGKGKKKKKKKKKSRKKKKNASGSGVMLKVFGTSENPNKMEKGGLGLPPTASFGVGGEKKRKSKVVGNG